MADLDLFVDVILSGGVLGVGRTESPAAVARFSAGLPGRRQRFDGATRIRIGRVLLVPVTWI